MGRVSIVGSVMFAVAACSIDPVTFTPPGDGPAGDGSPGACASTSLACASPVMLRECRAIGEPPLETPCPWGCLDGAPARCGTLLPASDVLGEMDLRPDPMLQDLTAQSPAGVIDSDTGEITNVRAAGEGILNGIEFRVRTIGTRKVGVFRFGKLTLAGDWRVRGSSAIAIAALGDVVLQGQLDLRGVCANGGPGPGGFDGGAPGTTASGPGGGRGGGTLPSGGGGGAHGAGGGNGGTPSASVPRPQGGNAFGVPEITMLAGGGGGGGGGGAVGGPGGGGGGAIHIAANGNLLLRPDPLVARSGINAGGCGGRGSGSGGGGGGAGGTILIEAAEVQLDGAHLAVNGGGGGGGAGDGQAGQLDTIRATGGLAGANGGEGGRGGAAGAQAGGRGADADRPGAGGGGVGRIRILTRLPDGVALTNGAVVSPTFEETGSTATKAAATVR